MLIKIDSFYWSRIKLNKVVAGPSINTSMQKLKPRCQLVLKTFNDHSNEHSQWALNEHHSMERAWRVCTTGQSLNNFVMLHSQVFLGGICFEISPNSFSHREFTITSRLVQVPSLDNFSYTTLPSFYWHLFWSSIDC